MISQGISIQSFSLTYTQSTTDQQTFRTNLKALIDAIKSGNLQDAQGAYGKITDALNASNSNNSSTASTDGDGDADGSGGTSDASSDSPFKAFLDAIGQALSSSNTSDAQKISDAQKALSDFEANRPKGPPPAVRSAIDQLSGSAKSAFIDLIKAIRSGDISSAKNSYSALLDQQNQNTTQNQSPLDAFLSQVGSALDNGDINAAQKALQALAQQQPQGAAVNISL